MRFTDLEIFKDIPEIKTERLVLRRIKRRDLADVFEYSSDPEVSRHLLWSPHLSKRHTAAYLRRVSALYKKGQLYDWAIEFMGKMIGTCGFPKIDILNGTAELGFVLNRAYWGMGLGKEAASAVMDFGFCRLGLARIESRYMVGNERSSSLMMRLGMSYSGIKRNYCVKDGLLRDIGVYSISREDYFNNKRGGVV